MLSFFSLALYKQFRFWSHFAHIYVFLFISLYIIILRYHSPAPFLCLSNSLFLSTSFFSPFFIFSHFFISLFYFFLFYFSPHLFLLIFPLLSLTFSSIYCTSLFSSLLYLSWARICKRLRSTGIDSNESIPPAYVAWWAGTVTLIGVYAGQAT